MTMPRKPVHGMTPTELAALNNWAAAMRAAKPKLKETAQVAQAIHKEMVAAPVWRVAEGQPEVGMERPAQQKDPWSIGPPKVNYVDHIDRLSDSHESVDERGQQS